MLEDKGMFGNIDNCEELALALMSAPRSPSIIDSIVSNHIKKLKPIVNAKAILANVKAGKADPSILEQDDEEGNLKL